MGAWASKSDGPALVVAAAPALESFPGLAGIVAEPEDVLAVESYWALMAVSKFCAIMFDRSGLPERSGDGFFVEAAPALELVVGLAGFVVAAEGVLAVNARCALETRLEAWAIMVDRSGSSEIYGAGFFAGAVSDLESSGSVGMIAMGAFAVRVCRAFEASTAAWTIMAERAAPVESMGELPGAGAFAAGADAGDKSDASIVWLSSSEVAASEEA